MPYTQFKHDVFLSYAVADNDGPYHRKRGWVQAFEEQLVVEIQREVQEKRPVELWLDRKRLSCGDPFDDEIRTAIDSTAILVILLSKQYLASEWCRMEREQFLQAITRQTNPERRIFVVELTDPKKLDKLPSELSRIHRVPMWETQGSVPKRCGHPVPDQAKPDHQPFYDHTLEVAYAIAERLNELATVTSPAATPVPISTPAAAGPAIFLAQPPRGTNEEQFARELTTKLANSIPPLRTVPDQPIPRTFPEAQAFLDAQLGVSRLFVQIVGHNIGTTPAGFPAPLPAFQRQRAEQAKVPLLLWRPKDVAVAEIEDADQRALAELALAGDAEDCRQALVARLKELAEQAKRHAAATSDGGSAGNGHSQSEKLFVNHLPDDEELARRVCLALQRQFVCVKRSFDGASEEELRLDFERNLQACESLLMVYGKIPKPAAREQMLECLKVMGRHSRRPISDWFVVAGPPEKPNPSLDLFFDGLHEIDCTRELETSLAGALAAYRRGSRP